MTTKNKKQAQPSQSNRKGGPSRGGAGASRESGQARRDFSSGLSLGNESDADQSRDIGRDWDGESAGGRQQENQDQGDHRHHYDRGYQDGYHASRQGMRDHLESGGGYGNERGGGQQGDDQRFQARGQQNRGRGEEAGRSQPFGGDRGDSRGQNDASYWDQPGNYGAAELRGPRDSNPNRGRQDDRYSQDRSGSRGGNESRSSSSDASGQRFSPNRGQNAGRRGGATEPGPYSGGTRRDQMERANDTTRFATAGQAGRSSRPESNRSSSGGVRSGSGDSSRKSPSRR